MSDDVNNEILVPPGAGKTSYKKGSLHAKLPGVAPRGITEGQWEKLYEGWSYGWPDNKCCDYAGTTVARLRHAIQKDPSIREKKELLKQTCQHLAQQNVYDSIKAQDIATTKWYLERKDRTYANKQQVDVQVTHKLSDDEVSKRLRTLVGSGSPELLDDTQGVVEAEYEEVLPDGNTEEPVPVPRSQ